MCFSAEASFGAGMVLSAVGIAAVTKSVGSSQVVFAGIPLIFAVQQITEGFVWLSVQNPGFASWQQPAVYLFLIFAQVVWPTWVPVSVFLLEKDIRRKKILATLSVIGIVLSCLLSIRLLTHNVFAVFSGYHIFYDFGIISPLIRFLGIFYLAITMAPPFLSGIRKMRLLGFFIIISYLISNLFFKDYLISVWCFFAALISVSVLYIITDLKTSFAKSSAES